MVDKKGKKSEKLAKSIRGVIKNERYLLILDGIRYAAAVNGIWGKLDISKEKDAKVVITTQYAMVLKSDKVKFVENLLPLSQPEALKMFQNVVGNDNRLPEAQAQMICDNACCGLPILIAPIAKCIKYQEDPIDWESYLDEWRYWPGYEVKETHQLFSILEKCYKQLQPSKQNFFLYGALYPANSEIYTDHFTECCIVQDFLQNVHPEDTNYSRLRREGIKILRHLANVSFFLEGEKMRYVKMNDFYRQRALHISFKDQCKIYVDNEQHEEALRSTLWKGATWVSMIGSQRDSLPENPNFGSLHTLLLQKSPVEIPPTYFHSMNNLLVLNLNGTKMRSLSCLSTLTMLKALYLNKCSELKIHSDEIQSDAIQSKGIQSLQHLQVFDIRGTKVNFVPCFENLWCLRISYIDNNKVHEISQLRNLEELTIEGCNQTSNAILVFRVTSNPWRFSLLHTLTLKNTSIVFKVAVVFPQLQNLVVQDSSGFEVLIEVTELEQNIFPKLKVLKLDNLSKMKSICSNGNLAWSSLVELELHVRSCSERNSLPYNKTDATKLRVIEGSNQWSSNLDESIREQLRFAFSASS